MYTQLREYNKYIFLKPQKKILYFLKIVGYLHQNVKCNQYVSSDM